MKILVFDHQIPDLMIEDRYKSFYLFIFQTSADGHSEDGNVCTIRFSQPSSAVRISPISPLIQMDFRLISSGAKASP